MFKFYQVLHLLFTVRENSPAFEITGEIVARKSALNAGGKSYTLCSVFGRWGRREAVEGALCCVHFRTFSAVLLAAVRLFTVILFCLCAAVVRVR